MAFDIPGYETVINAFYGEMQKHADISDVKIAEDKWTLKEMVGHLIDSASNNHQRFIRLQLEEKLVFPGYDAEQWKGASRVGGLDYRFIIQFWKQYNDFLLYIIENVDQKCLSNHWDIDGKQKSLAFLIEDYFEHLRFHRRLFDERVGEIQKWRAER